MKNKIILKISVILAVLIYIILLGNNVSFAGTLSSDINGIDENKYPGIKSELQNLKAKHPNYNFQVYYTGIDWTEAVTMEYQGHGSSPKNLFSVSNSYKGKWYCPICGSKTYDTGWYCASVEAIKYMMDPRNSFDETSVYQFKNLEASDVSSANIQAVINNKYASYSYINNPEVINAIVKASSDYTMNGYSILAKIVNEQGAGNSPLIAGQGYNGQYVGVYNFFNVGAYGNGTSTVITNGLKYAQGKGWTTKEKSILGGSEYYKTQYIGRGQNTLYYQRFNVVHTPSLFSHQYQQDIMGAQTSATLLKKYYEISSTINTVQHNFIIPLYENMPVTACSRPNTSENSELIYEDATVLVDKLTVKASPNSSRIISYLNKGEKVKVLNRATKASADGNYWDTIVTNIDGTYGYVVRSGISEKLPIYVFDSKYYADNNSDLKAAFGYDENKLLSHFTTSGINEGRAASPTFDVKYYLENNSDLKAAFGNDYMAAYKHFLDCGCKEDRPISKEYDTIFYRYYYADLTNLTPIQLMEHYIKLGRAEGRWGGLEADIENVVFDAETYATYNDDLKAAFGNNKKLLKTHWIQSGINEGRVASIIYDPRTYSTLNWDIKQAFGNNYRAIFEHYVKNGINEARRSSLVFDVSSYISMNSDIKSAFNGNCKQSILHFKYCGINEGRNSSLVFNVRTYLNLNSDLKAAFGNNYAKAYEHFLKCGINESRQTSDTFSLTYYSSKYEDLRNAFGKNYREYYIHYLTSGIKEGRKGI